VIYVFMRGDQKKQLSMLTPMTLERRVPKNHPLRQIKAMADEVLVSLSPTFDAMYSSTGRRSIPPETLLKSMLLIALYSVRSERMLRTARLQHALPLVPRHGHGGRELRSLELHAESRSAARA
jgi:transposase